MPTPTQENNSQKLYLDAENIPQYQCLGIHLLDILTELIEYETNITATSENFLRVKDFGLSCGFD